MASPLAALLCAAAALSEPRVPDSVTLRDGTKLEGRVVRESPAELVLLQGTRERSVEMKNVVDVVSRAANHREFLARWFDIDVDLERKTLDLASWCKRVDLLENARLLAQYVLVLSSSNEEAHELMGHERSPTGWLVKVGSKRWPWAEFQTRAARWNDALVLESTHYELRTNLELRAAVEILFTLECAYAGFYALFGEELKLREVTVPMKAQVHADKKSFPELAGNNGAYFDPGQRVLFVNAAERLELGLVIHEATHQLFDATVVRTRGSMGSIPTWINEGLAEYTRFAFIGPATRIAYDPRSKAQRLFQIHANTKVPLRVNRVLNLEASDYLVSTDGELKYAQSYTLVHWSLHAHGGRYRNAFYTFLRSAYLGQSSSTDFKKTIGLDDDAIDEDWTAYVRENAVR